MRSSLLQFTDHIGIGNTEMGGVVRTSTTPDDQRLRRFVGNTIPLGDRIRNTAELQQVQIIGGVVLVIGRRPRALQAVQCGAADAAGGAVFEKQDRLGLRSLVDDIELSDIRERGPVHAG